MAFDLKRFVKAQESCYQAVLNELRNGQKRSHWMWYVFPQIVGLGSSSTAQYYAIGGPEEARAYMNHPILGTRLKECIEAVLTVQNRSLQEIFGSPDDLKFRSSMTLFENVQPDEPLFAEALERYCEGHRDEKTLQILETLLTT